MKIPGKKKKLMTVIIFIEADPNLVPRAIAFISPIMCSMLLVDACDSVAIILLRCAFW